MPDGTPNFRPQGHQHFSQPPPGAHMPGATRPAGGLDRFIGLVKTFTVSSIGLAVIVFGFQAVMPEGRRPSDLIGSFHGSTESAELKVKQETAAAYERAVTDARTAPAVNWQMEQQVNQTQMQAVANSLGTQETAASIADFACFAAAFVTPIFGDTRDARDAAAAMQSACGEGDRIRQNMTQTIARTARQGSGLVPRSNPTTGAAQVLPSR